MRLRNLHKKENFNPEIKPMIENLTGQLYRQESEYAKCAKLPENIILEFKSKKCSKTYFNVLKKDNQNQTISKLYTDDKKRIYSIIPNNILRSAENLHKKL